MRNKHPGPCYRCGKTVAVGDGHFERFGHGWRVQHATCAIEHRGTVDPARQALGVANLRARATLTGKRGQRARQALKRLFDAPFNTEDF